VSRVGNKKWTNEQRQSLAAISRAPFYFSYSGSSFLPHRRRQADPTKQFWWGRSRWCEMGLNFLLLTVAVVVLQTQQKCRTTTTGICDVFMLATQIVYISISINDLACFSI